MFKIFADEVKCGVCGISAIELQWEIPIFPEGEKGCLFVFVCDQCLKDSGVYCAEHNKVHDVFEAEKQTACPECAWLLKKANYHRAEEIWRHVMDCLSEAERQKRIKYYDLDARILAAFPVSGKEPVSLEETMRDGLLHDLAYAALRNHQQFDEIIEQIKEKRTMNFLGALKPSLFD